MHHVTLTEKKISKQPRIRFKTKAYFNYISMVSLYYSLIHFYLNYGNIAWVSTAKTNLKNLYSQ